MVNVNDSGTQKVDLDVEKVKVKSLVDQFTQVWETKDMELFSRIMAHDADMVVFGSDAPEHWVGWEPLKESVEKMLPILPVMWPGFQRYGIGIWCLKANPFTAKTKD